MKTLLTIALSGMIMYLPNSQQISFKEEDKNEANKSYEKMSKSVVPADTYSCKCKKKTCKVISGSPQLCSCNSIKYIMKVLQEK